MDFDTLKKNMLEGKFATYEEFFADLQLIWDNCKLYNPLGSELYKIALKMEKLSKKELEKYMNDNNIQGLKLVHNDLSTT